jgi:hypothetical protein
MALTIVMLCFIKANGQQHYWIKINTYPPFTETFDLVSASIKNNLVNRMVITNQKFYQTTYIDITQWIDPTNNNEVRIDGKNNGGGNIIYAFDISVVVTKDSVKADDAIIDEWIARGSDNGILHPYYINFKKPPYADYVFTLENYDQKYPPGTHYQRAIDEAWDAQIRAKEEAWNIQLKTKRETVSLPEYYANRKKDTVRSQPGDLIVRTRVYNVNYTCSDGTVKTQTCEVYSNQRTGVEVSTQCTTRDCPTNVKQ